MRPILIILTLCLSSFAFSQDLEKLSDKAFDYYFRSKNIDSAILLYSIIQQHYPNYRPGYINHVLGASYFEKGETDPALRHLLTALRKADSTSSYMERASLYIGDLYFQSGEYNKALVYYDSSTSFYRLRKYQTRHRFREGDFSTIYKKAICFDKLNRTDTAIAILTPRVFLDFEDYPIDSTAESNMVNFYISLLKKKYSNKEIRREFKRSMKHIAHTRTIDSASYKRNPDWKTIFIDCYFYFLGTKVELYGQGFGVKDFNEKTPQEVSRKSILRRFHRNPTYKKLKAI